MNLLMTRIMNYIFSCLKHEILLTCYVKLLAKIYPYYYMVNVTIENDNDSDQFQKYLGAYNVYSVP